MTLLQKRITLSSQNRMLFGVCGGIAAYLNIDATLIRLAFVIVSLTVLSFDNALFVYFILWVIMPVQPKEKAKRRVIGRQLS